jgi:hypothetical protein
MGHAAFSIRIFAASGAVPQAGQASDSGKRAKNKGKVGTKQIGNAKQWKHAQSP